MRIRGKVWSEFSPTLSTQCLKIPKTVLYFNFHAKEDILLCFLKTTGK